VSMRGKLRTPEHSKPPHQTKTLARNLLEKLGPGLITGASDDDPSGIATYSQVGAQFGYGMLWTMLFSFPLMVAIQEISARIGRVTGLGIAANMRRHYSRPLLFGMVGLLVAANIFNLGADLGAMGASCGLFLPGYTEIYVVAFGLISLLLQIFVPYTTYVHYLKWITLALFSYVAVVFVVHVEWGAAIRATFLPSLFSRNPGYFTALIAVLGTTISPYLFFWQASEEAEDVRTTMADQPLKKKPQQAAVQLQRIHADTIIGMACSNLVAFFIMLTAATTLHAHGITDIQTATQAAKALEPLAGRFTFLLFAAGIVGTGMLAVPVLAGSAAYAVSEAFDWPASLERKAREAKGFYATIATATLAGLSLSLLHFNPIRALFWAAVLNGVVAVPAMVVVMMMTANRKVMGQFTLPLSLRCLGWFATIVMAAASIGLFVTLRR
jgi:NRAMP (natural resistance-associated macrophage protein)-like metal ion transporter